MIGVGEPFHPMKGPMTTQTLRGMDHHGPMHWRGDRSGGSVPEVLDPLNEFTAFTQFNGAFGGLLGRDEGPLTQGQMNSFARFALEIVLPPNPIRNLDTHLLLSNKREEIHTLIPPLTSLPRVTVVMSWMLLKGSLAETEAPVSRT